MTKTVFGSQQEGGMKNGKVQVKITARCRRIFMKYENKEKEARHT
jgi:hypothetical protein